MIDRKSYVPMYQQIKADIQEQILDGRIAIGDKLMSEAEMMAHYQVGRVTIRNALADLVSSGCLRKEQGLGTFCAAFPKNDDRRNIDVLLNTADQYFVPYFLTGISRILEAEKCNLILHDTQDSMDCIADNLHQILQRGTDGIILQPYTGTEAVTARCAQMITCCNQQQVPLITIDGKFKDIDTAYIINDDEFGCYKATRYLIDQGHRNILGLFPYRYRDSKFRAAGFRSAMEEAGLDVHMLNADDTDEQQWVAYINKENITGVICYNDYLAVQCYHSFSKNNIVVGKDVSVVGFDDTELSRTSLPRITTVTHPKEKMGEQAAAFLLNWIHGNAQLPYRFVFQPDLVCRESVCKLAF